MVGNQFLITVIVGTIIGSLAGAAVVEVPHDSCNIAPELKEEIKSYQDVTTRIIESIVKGPYKGVVHKR